MKKTLLQKISCLLSFSTLLTITVVAQTTISGTIKDKELEEPLISANIIIQGTTIGASTNIDGHYQLTSDHPLPWIIEVTYAGYNTVFIEVTKEGIFNADLDRPILLSKCSTIPIFPSIVGLGEEEAGAANLVLTIYPFPSNFAILCI